MKAIIKKNKPVVIDFWKKFNIMDAVDSKAELWNEAIPSMLNNGWQNMPR